MVRASLAVSILMASAPSCPDLDALATHGFTAPTLAIAEANAETDAAGVRVMVTMSVTNPNPFPLTISSVDYTVTLQGDPAFAGTQIDPSLPENGSRPITLTGVIATTSPAYRALQPNATAQYVISGTAHVDSPAGVPVDVEFSQSGTFVVPGKLPAP